MSWQKWVILGLALGDLAAFVGRIGRPHRHTQSEAVFAVFQTAIVAFLVVTC